MDSNSFIREPLLQSQGVGQLPDLTLWMIVGFASQYLGSRHHHYGQHNPGSLYNISKKKRQFRLS
jgi:hypothetical protein